MKKSLFRCVALILAMACVFTAVAFAVEPVRGDIDGDEKVTNTDLLLVAGYCVGVSELDEAQAAAADLNGDGEVSNSDIIGVARLVIGLDIDEEAPAEEVAEEKVAAFLSSVALEVPVNEDKTEEKPVEETAEPVEEKVEEIKEPVKSYTDDDVYWLSHIIYAEAGGESYKGQVAVGNVVLNRVKSSKFPNTIYGVIFQKSQFTPASSGSIYRTPSQSCINAAIAALEGENVVGGALYFNTVGLNSWAARNATFVTRIGSHNFYK